MKIRINFPAIQQQMLKRGLTYTAIDIRAKQKPTWAQKTIERASRRGDLRLMTVRKLARAIGCQPTDIAIFDDESSPTPESRNAA